MIYLQIIIGSRKKKLRLFSIS